MGDPVDPNSVPPWSQQPPASSPPAQWYAQPYPEQGYGQQYAQGYGPYGAPPYPGYPPYPPPSALRRQSRPGQVLASAVLAFVLSGLLILAGILLLFGASAIDSFGDAMGADTDAITAEIIFDGFVNLVAAGLLIAGGVSLTSAGRLGRSMLGWGAGITLAASVYWLIRTSGTAGAVVYVVAFDALAIIAIALMCGQVTSGWLAAHRTDQVSRA